MKKIFTAIVFYIFIVVCSADAQICGSCTAQLNQVDTSSIVINAGQTFCVDSLGVFNGTMVLNGGTICNKGIFKPKICTIQSGTINNYGNITFKNDVSISSTFLLQNNIGGIINAMRNISVNGSTVNNAGLINCNYNIEANSGSINNSGLINCNAINAANGVVNNTGTINTNQ